MAYNRPASTLEPHYAFSMCCIVLVAGFLGPRLAVFLLYIFDSPRMSAAFDSFLIGFLGFLILPWTTFMWAVCYAPFFGVSGFGWALVGFGVFMDIATYTGGRRRRQQQMG